MKEENRSKLKQAYAEKQEKKRLAQEKQQRAAEARIQFWETCQQRLNEVVVPLLEEVAGEVMGLGQETYDAELDTRTTYGVGAAPYLSEVILTISRVGQRKELMALHFSAQEEDRSIRFSPTPSDAGEAKTWPVEGLRWEEAEEQVVEAVANALRSDE